ncbi:hypothetical protein BJF78_27620 [Pseudonocardia sp. CNS-139]|nr:hypothetical protein BJF78_27620 [Pseudonocardia sp. CNS-139]
MASAALVVAPPPGGRAPWRLRLRREHPLLVQVVRYALVGGLGTLVNALVFLLLRTWLDTVPANLVALVVSTAVSTEANRRFTFGGAAAHRWRVNVQTGGAVVFYAFYSSAVLLLLAAVVAAPTPLEETFAVAAASVVGGTCRFLVLRYWVFRETRRTAHTSRTRHTGPAMGAESGRCVRSGEGGHAMMGGDVPTGPRRRRAARPARADRRRSHAPAGPARR